MRKLGFSSCWQYRFENDNFLASLIFHTLNFYANKHIKAWHLCINFMFFLSFPSGTCLSAHTRIEILLINLSHVFLYSSSLILSFVHCFLGNKQLKDNCFVREEFFIVTEKFINYFYITH